MANEATTTTAVNRRRDFNELRSSKTDEKQTREKNDNGKDCVAINLRENKHTYSPDIDS
jgi:hypothetical protein